MKPLWAALGIILLLSSVVIVVGANVGTWERSDIDWKSDPSPVELSNSWNVSRVLNESDWFKLEISSSADWNDNMEPAGSSYSVPYKPAFVNVTNPNGNETEFLCDFLKFSDSETAGLVLYNITIDEVHGIDGIRFELPYGNNTPGIVARVLSSGNYTARVWWLFGGGSAPFTMKLTKGVLVKTVVDNSGFYPVGFGVFCVSVVLLVYGFRKSKTVSRRKNKDDVR